MAAHEHTTSLFQLVDVLSLVTWGRDDTHNPSYLCMFFLQIAHRSPCQEDPRHPPCPDQGGAQQQDPAPAPQGEALPPTQVRRQGVNVEGHKRAAFIQNGVVNK